MNVAVGRHLGQVGELPGHGINAGKIESTTGDVTLAVPDGRLLDANDVEQRDDKTAAELLALWDSMRLRGDPADNARNTWQRRIRGQRPLHPASVWPDAGRPSRHAGRRLQRPDRPVHPVRESRHGCLA